MQWIRQRARAHLERAQSYESIIKMRPTTRLTMEAAEKISNAYVDSIQAKLAVLNNVS